MPVRRPRWPTAVSAAFEAYGGPRPQLRAELDEPPRPPIGEVTSLSVGVSVSRWVCRSSLVWGSIDRLRLPCLGPSVRPGDQGFGNDRTQVFGCLVFVCVWWSVCGSVCVCLSTRPSPQVPPLTPRLVLSCPPRLDLRLSRKWPVSSCLWVLFVSRTCRRNSARSALCAVFGVCFRWPF